MIAIHTWLEQIRDDECRTAEQRAAATELLIISPPPAPSSLQYAVADLEDAVQRLKARM